MACRATRRPRGRAAHGRSCGLPTNPTTTASAMAAITPDRSPGSRYNSRMLRALLESTPPDADTLGAWWNATRDARQQGATTGDRALIGGALADRLGFAFAVGYEE